MTKKARLGLYVKDEEFKRQIKVAAAKRGLSATDYCTKAIEERLVRDAEMNDLERKKALLVRMKKLSDEVGPIGTTAAKLIKAGRRR